MKAKGLRFHLMPSECSQLLSRVEIRLTVENTSNVAVTLIQLTFTDSVSLSLREILTNDGELSSIETYELTRELQEKPTFSYNTSAVPKRLDPGCNGTLSVSCLGKAGW